LLAYINLKQLSLPTELSDILKIKKSYKKKDTQQKPPQQPGSPTHANLKPFGGGGGTSDDENQ
jgi:hypothetical protein